MDLYILSSQDVNWWTEVVWSTCGLLWCFYQLFGLSFWRHPFTADDPLLSKWWSATFLQIWWRNKLIDISFIFITYIDAKTNQNEALHRKHHIGKRSQYYSTLSSKQFISCQMSYFTKLRSWITRLYYVIADCCYQPYFVTFTFMHLADAFIQSDFQCIQATHIYFFISMCVPWELNPQPFALLTQCSTTEPQEHTSLNTIRRHSFLCDSWEKSCKPCSWDVPHISQNQQVHSETQMRFVQ